MAYFVTYAMTGTLYRCVMGINPLNASARLVGDDLRIDRSLVTQKQAALLEKGLSLEPEKRFQSMLELARAIADCLHDSEKKSLYQQYPQLQPAALIKKPDANKDVPKEPDAGSAEITSVTERTPEARKTGPLSRRLLAFALDMLLFQGSAVLLLTQLGGSVLTAALAGIALGVLVSWGMTASKSRASPGEILCALYVGKENGERPDAGSALLYCLCRMCWPLKPIDVLCLLIKKKVSESFWAVAVFMTGERRKSCLTPKIGQKPKRIRTGQLRRRRP